MILDQKAIPLLIIVLPMFNILGKIDTKSNWQERKTYCLTNVYSNKAKLLADSKNPKNVSLATFKPSRFCLLKLKKMKGMEK
jgi:hypothetical protein